MSKKFLTFLLIMTFLVGCTREPTASVVRPTVPTADVGDIVKSALPDIEQIRKEPIPIEVKSADSEVFASITVNEGDLVKLDLDATDPDGDSLTFTFSAPLTNDGEWQTGEGDAGEYPVSIMVSDGVLQTTREILVIVKSINKPPRLQIPTNIEVTEGQFVSVNLQAQDPDNDRLTWTYSKPLDSDGNWQTKAGDQGEYQVTVEVSDGKLDDSATFFIKVLPGNLPPSLKVESSVTVKEGETVKLTPTASDPEGTRITLTYSGWMTSDTYKTDFNDAGQHKVVITASDGEKEESAVVWVTVEDVNRPPQIHGLILK